MVDVDDVYALHAAKSLVAVGWVHTLPSAAAAGAPPPVAVLSGEQAHTQAAFQVALPEAVAVLVSPARPGGGTPGPGGGSPAARPTPRATAVRLGGEAAVAAVRACTERYVSGTVSCTFLLMRGGVPPVRAGGGGGTTGVAGRTPARRGVAAGDAVGVVGGGGVRRGRPPRRATIRWLTAPNKR